MKTDLALLAAALAKAPLPLEAEMGGLTVVSLRRLLPDLRAARAPDLKITSLLRSILIEGLFPFFSLDPAKTPTAYHLDRLEPRMDRPGPAGRAGFFRERIGTTRARVPPGS